MQYADFKFVRIVWILRRRRGNKESYKNAVRIINYIWTGHLSIILLSAASAKKQFDFNTIVRFVKLSIAIDVDHLIRDRVVFLSTILSNIQDN